MRPPHTLALSRAGIYLLLFYVMAALSLGCQSPRSPTNDSLASIEIKGRTPLEIARITSEVFREASFLPVRLPPNKGMNLLFEKEGTTTDTVFYGGLSGSKIWYRAKISIETLNADTQLLKCDAYRVVDKGDPRFEEEKKLSSLKKGTYRALLNQVKARLNSQPGAPLSQPQHVK